MDNLVLIQWYNFKSTKNQYQYGCPRLKLMELYNIVNVEAIKNNIYTVPDSIRYPLFIYKYKIAYNLQTNNFKKNLSYKFVAFSLNYNSVR